MFIDPNDYGPAIAPLVRNERVNSLRLQSPNDAARDDLKSLGTESAFEEDVVDSEMAHACLAGLWLYHDFGEEAHEIAQSINTSTGSFWHGIYHRREPDFWNSKYWFSQVQRHSVFGDLLAAARQEAEEGGADDIAQWLDRQSTWDPAGFVDLCQEVIDTGTARERVCERIQQAEWELLFDFCFRRAIGA